jgi:F-type H+-transporting ATPase subunit gamma
MQKLEMLQRKIKNAEEIQSIVRTMKVMAAVEINQFEKSVESIGEYYNTLELGLQIVLKEAFSEVKSFLTTDDRTSAGIIVLGSGQALCGPFDESILSYVLEENEKKKLDNSRIFVLGERLSGYMEQNKLNADRIFQMPGSVNGINKLVLDLLSAIENWQSEDNIRSVKVFHHQPISRKGYESVTHNLLPLDKSWLERLGKKKWPTNNLPTYTIDSNTLFMSLLRQYLFVSLYRAVAESLAAEYSSRLSAMQRAEVKIDERLYELSREFTHERQASITGELLDIMAGFESVKSQ